MSDVNSMLSDTIKVMLTATAGVFTVLAIGCCGSKPESKVPDRYEVVSEQYIKSEKHMNFSIMVIKDKKTEKEIRVIFNNQWGMTQND